MAGKTKRILSLRNQDPQTSPEGGPRLLQASAKFWSIQTEQFTEVQGTQNTEYTDPTGRKEKRKPEEFLCYKVCWRFISPLVGFGPSFYSASPSSLSFGSKRIQKKRIFEDQVQQGLPREDDSTENFPIQKYSPAPPIPNLSSFPPSIPTAVS